MIKTSKISPRTDAYTVTIWRDYVGTEPTKHTFGVFIGADSAYEFVAKECAGFAAEVTKLNVIRR